MKKHIIIICMVLLLILNIGSCAASNADTVTLNELKNNSEPLMCVSSFSKYEVEKKGDTIYTKIGVLYLGEWQKTLVNSEITIVEEKESCLDDEGVYLVFLTKTEESDCYSLTNGKSGVFEIEEGKIIPLDRKLKKEVQTYWNNDIENVYEWFAQNYNENEYKNDITAVTPEQSSVPISTTDIEDD